MQENEDSMSVFVHESGPVCGIESPALDQEAEILHLVPSGVSNLCTEHPSWLLLPLLWLSTLKPCVPPVPSTMAGGFILKSQG